MRRRRRGRPVRQAAVVALLVLASCSSSEGRADAPSQVVLSAATLETETRDPLEVAVTVRVLDEMGEPVSDAEVRLGDRDGSVDQTGRVTVDVDQPVAGVVEAAGYLPEPLVVSPWEQTVTVRMLARRSAAGVPRVAYHFGGDTMLGRRYIAPTRADTARFTVGDPDSARRIVASLSPLFAAADVRSVNLETVVGELSDDAAYAGKRFLLQSPPEIIGALDQLGVDVVTLGNNHLNDWEGAGVQQTLQHLDAGGIARVGAGATSEEASEGLVLDAGDTQVGLLSYTTVNGDFVNDSLPGRTARPPAELAEGEAWQYELRAFGYEGLIDTESRRIGEVWPLYEALENDLDEATAADLWGEMRAVYPELQDWVARRGHGGAAWYRRSEVEAGVASLRARGADVVIVQLHAGYQFAEVPSSFVQGAAHASIDAGADLVVGHHPHVLQGFEFYRDRLIAYSLGNLVFDQDFLSTFSSAMLRTVFEGDTLLEARVFPVLLDDYRPVPLAGPGADRVMKLLDARSASRAAARRIDGAVAPIQDARRTEAVDLARLEVDGTSARIVADERQRERMILESAVVDQVDLGGRLVQADGATPGLQLGRDLFGWGDFEDSVADGRSEGGAIWDIDPTDRNAAVIAVADAPSGDWLLRVRAVGGPESEKLVRPIARVTRVDHRLVDDQGRPVDGDASYSLRANVRSGGGSAVARFDVYHFDDTDPTADPTSDLVRRIDIPLGVPPDGNWHSVEVDLPASTFAASGGVPANAAMFYVGVVTSSVAGAEAQFDDVRVIEWRSAAELPEGSWHEVDAIRTPTNGPIEIVVSAR